MNKNKKKMSIKEFFLINQDSKVNYLFQWIFLFCVIVHGVYFISFVVMKVFPLAIFNVVSICIHLLCLFLTQKKHLYRSVFIAIVEVITFSVTSTVFFGWDMQFQILIIALIPTLFFFPFKHLGCPFLWGTISVIAFVATYTYTGFHEPLALVVGHQILATVLKYSNIIVSLAVVLTLSFLFGRMTRENQARLRRTNLALKTLASTDPLTGLVNRRSMAVEMETALKRARSGISTSVIVIGDIDNFKSINDNYGHNFGDEVLVSIARIFLDTLSESDVVCRWGGEEILVLLQDTTLTQAGDIIELLRKRLAETAHLYKDEDVNVTMTFGLSLIDINTSYDQAISQADANLYLGKSKGKNCVIV